MPNNSSDLYPHLLSVNSRYPLALMVYFSGKKSESQVGKRCINKRGGKAPSEARGKTELLEDLCV